MAWNKPSTENQQQKKSNAKTPSATRGIVAGSVVVALVIGAYFAFFFDSEEPQKVVETKMPTTIKEVSPAKIQRVAEENSETNVVSKHRVPTYIDEHGVERYEGGLRVYHPAERRISLGYKSVTDVFENAADKAIADLIIVEPGTSFMGDFKYGRIFKNAFANSLGSRIEIKDSDDQRTRELKQAVIDAKAELIQRIKGGEDVCDIMNETRSELQRLGQVREQLRDEIRNYRKNPDATEEDLGDLISAANKMLEAKGLKPIKTKAILARNLQYQKGKKE